MLHILRLRHTDTRLTLLATEDWCRFPSSSGRSWPLDGPWAMATKTSGARPQSLEQSRHSEDRENPRLGAALGLRRRGKKHVARGLLLLSLPHAPTTPRCPHAVWRSDFWTTQIATRQRVAPWGAPEHEPLFNLQNSCSDLHGSFRK